MAESVILIGPMGVGKTTIGKKLAKALRMTFIDTDKEIVKDHGSITKIFDKAGEDHFRSLETDYLVGAIAAGGVVATGGGVVTQPKNRELLRENYVIYLSSNGLHMASRLLVAKRPLLKNGMSDWKRIYDQRKPWYQEVATVEVDTSGKPLALIVSEIVELVKARA
jgi:shikimate kinase